MFDRRDTLRLGLAAIPALWLAPHVACAGGIHERLYPFLIDLPGWDGVPPAGQVSPGGDVVELMAVRHYARAMCPCVAAILVGPQTKGPIEMIRSGLQHDDGATRVAAADIDGFRTQSTFLISHGMGSIMVPLADSALFSLSFASIGETEALGLARRFDWKAMRAALPGGTV